MALRNTIRDIERYKDFPEIVRRGFENREYPKEDDPFISKWLKAREREKELSDLIKTVAFEYVVIIPVCCALLIPFGQAALWLYKGYWVPIPFIKLLHYLGVDTFIFLHAIENPTTWIGLAKIVNWWLYQHVSVHIILYSCLIGLIIYCILFSLLKLLVKVPQMKN